jgi:hypothetical protein
VRAADVFPSAACMLAKKALDEAMARLTKITTLKIGDKPRA